MVPQIAFGCSEALPIILWSPRPGLAVKSSSVALRGFVCAESPVLMVKNLTTHGSQMIETKRVCRGGRCVSSFAALVKNLAPGPNRLSASTPDGRAEISLEVIRSALALER